MAFDIFISYKNDNAGNNFASRIKDDLEALGYSVYFNSDEAGEGHFPDRLKKAIHECKDFLLIISEGCLAQLKANNKIDWIREELLTAYAENKHIIPVLMDGVTLPKDRDEMPESLKDLLYIDAVSMPEQYKYSPLEKLLKNIQSNPERNDVYRDVVNSNPYYNVHDDFINQKKQAEAGSFDAMYELANMYYYGFTDEEGGTKRNTEKAYYWLNKLASTKNPYQSYALSTIGFMYYHGTVPHEEQSYEKSLEYSLRASAEIGASKAHASYMKSIGSGCAFDYDEAEREYLDAAEKGDTEAKRGLGKFYLSYGKHKEAAKAFSRIYSKDSFAAYELGMMYKKGILTDPPCPDYFRAAFYFMHETQKDGCDPKVYYELGLMYFNPTEEFPKDFEQAQKCFQKAADQGHIEAQYVLGYMYEYGLVERNLTKSVYYYSKAAEMGHSGAQMHLVTLYQQHEVKNYHKAFRCAQQVARAGGGAGSFLYANLLFFGRGCEPDMNEAYKYYKYAYEHGYYQAKFMMEKIGAIQKTV